ncbi:hypothetical protein M3J09_006719 [Ascochyta lentis]
MCTRNKPSTLHLSARNLHPNQLCLMEPDKALPLCTLHHANLCASNCRPIAPSTHRINVRSTRRPWSD